MMKKWIFILFLSLTIIFILPAQESGTPEPCLPCALWAYGNVYTTDGTPIEGATVSMTTEEEGTVVTVTDGDGYYELHLPTCGCGGEAEFIVSKAGYIPKWETHDVSANGTNIDFVLIDTDDPVGRIWFVPKDTRRELLNLIFWYTGIPTIPFNISSDIIGDFTITNEVHVDTGAGRLASYNLKITYDPSVVIVNTSEGQNGISPGEGNFIMAADNTTPGSLVVSGFDISGTGVGPSSDFHLFTINWLAQTYNGRTDLTIAVDSLLNTNNTEYHVITGSGSITIETVTIVCVILGDLNSDGKINIIDAMFLAQHYVNLNPAGIDLECADVNCDGVINIIDALLIAQYYVGLITEFC